MGAIFGMESTHFLCASVHGRVSVCVCTRMYVYSYVCFYFKMLLLCVFVSLCVCECLKIQQSYISDLTFQRDLFSHDLHSLCARVCVCIGFVWISVYFLFFSLVLFFGDFFYIFYSCQSILCSCHHFAQI